MPSQLSAVVIILISTNQTHSNNVWGKIYNPFVPQFSHLYNEEVESVQTLGACDLSLGLLERKNYLV
jgi:hypothetical protein